MSSLNSSNHNTQSAPIPTAQQKSRPDSPSCGIGQQTATSDNISSTNSQLSRCANDAFPPLPQGEGRGEGSLPTTPSPHPSAPTPPPNRRDLPALKSQLTPLSTRQQNAIELLVMGKTDAAVAHDLNIHRCTVTKWRLYNHIFQAELNRRRQEVWGSAADQVRALLRHAVRAFRRQIRSEDTLVSFRAAQSLLNMAGQSRFAPPDEPVDPHGVLDQHARKKRIEFNSIDPRTDLLDDDDRAMALAELLTKQQEEE